MADRPRPDAVSEQFASIHLGKIQIDYEARVGFWNCASDQRAWPVESQNPEARVRINLDRAGRTDGSSSTTTTVGASPALIEYVL
jgi:hypothetical protein